MRLRRNRAGPRAGLTLLELTLATAALLLMAKLTLSALDGLQRSSQQASVATRLQEEGERALKQVVGTLRRSGFVNAGSATYPHLFDDGQPAAGFAAHAHAAPVIFPVRVDGQLITPATANREIVFLLPLDADAPGDEGHGVPDVDAAGALAWDAVEHSFVVLPTPDGRNELQQRIDGDSPVVVASDVESFRCLDTSIPGVDVPADALRIELALRARDELGRWVRYTTTAVVRLRNG